MTGTTTRRQKAAGARPAVNPKRPRSMHGPAAVGPDEDRLWTRLVVVLAAVLAAALLFVALVHHRVGDVMAETDFYGDYAEGARLVQQGRLLPSRYGVVGPGYELALALAGFVVPRLFLAAQLLSIAASVATLLCWFLLLRRRVNARVGLLAAVFIAVNATFFRQGHSVTTDAFAIALQSAALWLLLARDGPRAWIGAGVLSALAFLTRYNAIYLLPAGLLAILLGGTSATRRPRAALLFAAGFAAPVLPWVLYSLSHGGAFSLQLHHNIAFEVFARTKDIPWDDYQRDLQPQFKNLWDVIARDPGAVLGRMVHNVWDHLRRDALELLGWPVALAAGAGVLLGIRDGSLRRLWPAFVAGGLLFLTLVPIFYGVRYSLALLPLYAALAAIAFVSPLGALPVGPGGRIWVKTLLAALPIAFAVKESVAVQAHLRSQLPVEVLECGETLWALKRPGDRIICRKPHVAYYGAVKAVAFPFTETLPELADYAHKHRIRWLYYSVPEAETRARYYYLLDTTAVVPGLTPRRVTAPHPAVLYEIGPEFGRLPVWWDNDTLRVWHLVRGQLMVDGANPKVLSNYAGVALALGRTQEARSALERVLMASPRDVRAMNRLASVLLAQRDLPRAEALFRRALRLEPSNVEAQAGLGWVSLLGDRPQEAAERWRPLIPLTQDEQTLHRMAQLFHELGDVASANAALQRRPRRGGPRCGRSTRPPRPPGRRGRGLTAVRKAMLVR